MHSLPALLDTLLNKFGHKDNNHRFQSNTGFHRKLHFEQCEDRRMLTEIFTVKSYLDITMPGEGLTLRQAIEDAEQSPGEDTIIFDSSLDGQTITLTEGTALEITESVTIDATMLPNGLTIDA